MEIPERIYRYEEEPDRLVLQTQSLPVARSLDLKPILDQMFYLMHAAQGIGLAAPQVGINLRFFTVEIEEHRRLVFINPEILSTSSEESVREEGCLSLPKLYAKVKRPASVKVQARDASHRLFTIEAEGLLATCIQHEIDHLNGILFVDHLPLHTRENLLKRYQKMVSKQHRRGGK